jgi:hypothetical protein
MAGDRRALWLLTEALALNSMWSQVPGSMPIGACVDKGMSLSF